MRYKKQKNQEDNLSVTVENLIQLLNLKVSKKAIKNELVFSPDYPSILALSDALFQWNVTSMFAKIPYEQLDNIPLPAIFLSSIEQGDTYYIITKVNSSEISIIDSSIGGIKKVPHQEFQRMWNGELLLIEVNEFSQERDYQKRKQEDKINKINFLLAVLLLCIFFAIIPLYYIGSPFFVIYVLKLIGLYACILLIVSQFDKENHFVKKICKLGGHDTSCSLVTNSPASKLFGWLNFSEIGLIYFLGGALSVLFTNMFSTNFSYYMASLALLNLITLPYTVFSLYYQFIKLKIWCPLCFLVQIVLWSEFLAFLNFDTIELNLAYVNSSEFLLLVSVFLLVFCAWVILKPPIIRSIERDIYAKHLNFFLKDRRMFYAYLNTQPKEEVLSVPFELIVQEQESSYYNEVLIIISLFCSSCGNTFKEALNILEMLPNVKVKLRFNIKNSENYDSISILNHLFAVALQQGRESALNALKDWYDIRVLDRWMLHNPINLEDQVSIGQSKNITEQYVQWHEYSQIQYTPALMVNNILIPSLYDIYDVKHHIKYYQENIISYESY